MFSRSVEIRLLIFPTRFEPFESLSSTGADVSVLASGFRVVEPSVPTAVAVSASFVIDASLPEPSGLPSTSGRSAAGVRGVAGVDDGALSDLELFGGVSSLTRIRKECSNMSKVKIA